MVKILIGCTGSVATIKLPVLIETISKGKGTFSSEIDVRICLTEHSKHFLQDTDLNDVCIYSDSDEWAAWSNRGDPVLHIELAKWADILLIAPLDANTLAKIANISTLKSWGYYEIPVIEKQLICGDVGPGAMAEVETIVDFLKSVMKEKNIE
ncbi:unnamed protein product [Phaedon cochleariae]|uniref:Flavoprotein domain-containing protein n=1 Tax=Phaedon cochleariae TaxID=80249 RepID=A0A9P0GPM6_PHACE|nr:unnamed protein product [Phaedon cochleariae]